MLETGRSWDIPSEDDCDKFLSSHQELLQVQDAVYGHLRLIAPTETEIKRTRLYIVTMKAYWEKLECSETPKAHLLFTHAVPQMVRLNGIGDKPDDILEIEHQFYNKIEVALTRQGWKHFKQNEVTGKTRK